MSGLPVRPRVERAHDARGAAGLGGAGRRAGDASASPGCARRASRSSSVVALAYRATTRRASSSSGPYWWGILGLIGWAYLGVASLYLAGRRSARGPDRPHRPLLLRRAGRRRRRVRVALDPRPDRRADRRNPRRDRARGHAAGRAPEAPPDRGRVRLALRGGGARLRGARSRRRGCSSTPCTAPPGLPSQQDPRDRALGPLVLGPHVRGLGRSSSSWWTSSGWRAGPVHRDRRREPADRLPDGAVPAVALRALRATLRRPDLYAGARRRRPASASSARRSSPGSSCASAAGCAPEASASSCDAVAAVGAGRRVQCPSGPTRPLERLPLGVAVGVVGDALRARSASEGEQPAEEAGGVAAPACRRGSAEPHRRAGGRPAPPRKGRAGRRPALPAGSSAGTGRAHRRPRRSPASPGARPRAAPVVEGARLERRPGSRLVSHAKPSLSSSHSRRTCASTSSA